jgi:prepilin-type N-terminal cleavage/methylation domain-containing protein
MNKNLLLNRQSLLPKGLTLIEILVVLAVMAVLLAFATPSMQGVSARANIKAATENTTYAFRMAQNTARAAGKPVTLTLTTSQSGNAISFNIPGHNSQVVDGLSMPDIHLPLDLSVTASPASYTFDPMGRIIGFEEPGTVVIASAADASFTATLTVANDMGRIMTEPDRSEAGQEAKL